MARVTVEKYDAHGKYVGDKTVSEGTARNLIATWPKEYKLKAVPEGQMAEIEIIQPKKKVAEKPATPAEGEKEQLNPEIVKGLADKLEASINNDLVEKVVKIAEDKTKAAEKPKAKPGRKKSTTKKSK